MIEPGHDAVNSQEESVGGWFIWNKLAFVLEVVCFLGPESRPESWGREMMSLSHTGWCRSDRLIQEGKLWSQHDYKCWMMNKLVKRRQERRGGLVEGCMHADEDERTKKEKESCNQWLEDGREGVQGYSTPFIYYHSFYPFTSSPPSSFSNC